jgi:hypothetical protein
VLTASLGTAGSSDAAKAVLKGLRRAQPNISLAWLASGLPFEHEVHKAQYLEGFKGAGLGEGEAALVPAARRTPTKPSGCARP